MAFYDAKGHKLRHRGGVCYWCNICKEMHAIEKWNTPDGPKYIMDPRPISEATDKQKEEFKEWLKSQGLKQPKEGRS